MKEVTRHSLCGSVDWNRPRKNDRLSEKGHSLCGSVDWNLYLPEYRDQLDSHSLCGSVDWNLNEMPYLRIHAVTPYVGVWIETFTVRVKRNKPGGHSLCGSVDWNVNLSQRW